MIGLVVAGCFLKRPHPFVDEDSLSPSLKATLRDHAKLDGAPESADVHREAHSASESSSKPNSFSFLCSVLRLIPSFVAALV